VTLERFCEVVQELKKRGDIGIAEPQGQADQRDVVRLHGRLPCSFPFSRGAQRRYGRGLLLSLFEAVGIL
jgi:hypothetical protein